MPPKKPTIKRPKKTVFKAMQLQKLQAQTDGGGRFVEVIGKVLAGEYLLLK